MMTDILHIKVVARVFTAICYPIPTSFFVKDNIASDANTPCGWVQPVCLYSILKLVGIACLEVSLCVRLIDVKRGML
jgi:hypothetical protein